MDDKYRHIGHPAVRLMEECAEAIKILSNVIKITSKGLRFGWDGIHPDRPIQKTNFHTLKDEIDDIILAYKDLVVLANPQYVDCDCGAVNTDDKGFCVHGNKIDYSKEEVNDGREVAEKT